MKIEGAVSYPLHWPAGWPRTKTPGRSRFDGTFAKIRNELWEEIGRIGGRYPVMSTNIPLKRDGMPYAGQKEPGDPGVAVYFERRGRLMVFACDKWDRVQDNMRAIQRTIEAMRDIERWGASEMMERAFQAFEALPLFDGPPILFETMIFGGEHDQYQERCSTWEQARKAHPDAGGSDHAMAELNRARAEALSAN